MTELTITTPLQQRLHETFAAGAYDNWRVWAGAISIDIDDLTFSPVLARAYRHDGVAPIARVRCELFVADIEPATVRRGHVRGRVRTNCGGRDVAVPMHLCCDAEGVAQLCGANFVLESDDFALQHTGAFSYSIDVSAHSGPDACWVAVDDIAASPPGVIVG